MGHLPFLPVTRAGAHAEGQNPSTQVAHPRLIRGPAKNRGRGWAGLLHPWKAVDGTEDTAVPQDGQTGRQAAAMSRKLAEPDPSFPSFRGYPSEVLPSSKFLMGNEATWGSIGHVRRSAGPSAKSPAWPPVFHLQESWSRGAPTLSEASSCPGWEGEAELFGACQKLKQAAQALHRQLPAGGSQRTIVMVWVGSSGPRSN